MTRSKTLLIATAAFAVVAGSGLLLAQPEDGATADPNTPEVTLPMSKTAQLSEEEMRTGADSAMEDLRTTLERLIELREVARQSQDIIKLNCVNDKLLLLKQVVNIAEESKTDLSQALAENKKDDAQFHYGKVQLAREQADTQRNEAEGCIGEEMIFLGPTKVEVSGPNILDEVTGERDWFDFDGPNLATPFN